MNVTVTEATIPGLMSSTNYSIQVAAENAADIGDYTDSVTVETRQSKLLGYTLLLCDLTLLSIVIHNIIYVYMLFFFLAIHWHYCNTFFTCLPSVLQHVLT